MSTWLVLAVMAVSTLALRSAFIVSGVAASSSRFDSLRRFVPVAALTAIIVPALAPRGDEPLFGRPVAAAVAVVVAYYGRNNLWPVVAGMLALWATMAAG